MQAIVPEYVSVLVDVVYGELDRRHDASSHVALGDVTAVREEASNIHVASPRAAEVDRLLSVASHGDIEANHGDEDAGPAEPGTH